jgi:hypothetical protein
MVSITIQKELIFDRYLLNKKCVEYVENNTAKIRVASYNHNLAHFEILEAKIDVIGENELYYYVIPTDADIIDAHILLNY